MFEYLPRKDNPLDSFLKQASVVTDVVQASAIQALQYPEFTRNSEERNFCLDLCDRVDRIAYAYDRLCELCLVSPRYSRTKSIPVGGGFTRCDIASLRQWDAITQSVYLAELGMSEPIDREAEVAKNSAMILRRTANERLDHRDVIRIKAFGVREPDLDRAISDLAEILAGLAIQRMISIHRESLQRFGFEQFPGVGGPTFSVRIF